MSVIMVCQEPMRVGHAAPGSQARGSEVVEKSMEFLGVAALSGMRF